MAGERERFVSALNKYGDSYIDVSVSDSIHRDAHRIADLLEADAAELAELRKGIHRLPDDAVVMPRFLYEEMLAASPPNEAKDKGEGND